MVEFERGVLIGKIKTTCLRKTRPGSPVCCFGNFDWSLVLQRLQKAFSQGNRFHTQTKIELESLLIYINQQFNRLFEPFKIHHSKFELTKSYLHKFDKSCSKLFHLFVCGSRNQFWNYCSWNTMAKISLKITNKRFAAKFKASTELRSNVILNIK